MASSPRPIPPFIIGQGKKMLWGGLNTATGDPRGLAPGETPDAQNWITGRNQDHIELRRGKFLLGATRRDVAGASITGLGIGTTNSGQQVPFFSFAEKLLYYNSAAEDTIEIGTEANPTNVLGAAANGEQVAIVSYQNLAGAFTYVMSPHSSIFKIANCKPTSVSDQGYDDTNQLLLNQYGEVQDFLFGFARIDDGRMYCMNRYGRAQGSQDQTGLYVSHYDRTNLIDFTNALPVGPTAVVTTASMGGTIPANTYYFVVTSVNSIGQESYQGVEASIMTSGATSTITFTFPNIAGAVFYNIYGSTSSGSYTSPALAGVVYATPPGGGDVTLTIDNVTFTTGAPPATSPVAETEDVATGDGTTVTFTGNFSIERGVKLASPITIFAVQITDGVEYFTDNKLGVLTGSLGGTGTIDYITYAYSVTFNTAPANDARITVSFFEEDATRDGIIDFVENDALDSGKLVDPGTALVFRQDDGGGNAQAVFPFNGVEYAFHVLRSWQTQVDDFSTASNGGPTTANSSYFEQIGIPYPRAAFPTGQGVIFLDNSKPAQPEVKVLTIPPGSTNLTVVPVSLSLDQLDISGYAFDQAVIFQWDEYNILACKGYTNGMEDTYNDVVFMQNINSGKWDQLTYTISCLADFAGSLLGGDSLSANVFELFSGWDDDQNTIQNYYNTSPQDLEIDGLKTVGYIHMRGLIQSSQQLKISYSLDGSAYTYLFTINGNGSYVSTGAPVTIGSRMVGSNVIGGGNGPGPLSDVVANEYELDILIQSDLFEYISLQFQAINIGYVSVDNAGYKDIRWKRRRLLPVEDIQVDY